MLMSLGPSKRALGYGSDDHCNRAHKEQVLEHLAVLESQQQAEQVRVHRQRAAGIIDDEAHHSALPQGEQGLVDQVV